MDVILRYFNEKKNQADVRNFDSKFLGHPNAKNILASLNQSIEKLCPNKLIQLAMDGPATNWALFDLLCTQRELEENLTLMNVGRCGLHVIHGAFKTGVQAIKWNICKLLRTCYTLFHDSPARRADFVTVASCDIFPFAFCSTRWVEDKKVAERELLIWDNIKKIVKFWERLAKSKCPQCKSYETVLDATKDELITVKLQFFSFVASLLDPVLVQYQTNWPMIPYYYQDFLLLVKSLMRLIIKSEMVETIKTGKQLQDFF